MAVLHAVLLLGPLTAAPLWWVRWLHRHPRPLRKPGAAWVGFAAAIAVGWFGGLVLYLAIIEPESTGEGHPLAMKTTLAICGIAIIAWIAGSTLSWRDARSARRRDAQLGLTAGHRWLPDWLAGLLCIFGAPAAVIIAWMAAAAVAESISPTSTQEQFNGRVFPSFITAGTIMTAGLIYFYLIRPALKKRETQRLSSSNRSYLDTESPGDDYLNPPA